MKLLRTRDTAATRNRLVNFVILIDKLKEGSMDLSDICNLLMFSPSGARKYIRELQDAELITTEHTAKGNVEMRQVFSLTTNTHKVEAYIEAFQIGKAVNTKPRNKPARTHLDRNLHIINDDVYYRVKVEKLKIPEHTQLMSLFYSMPVSN